jgi:alpha-1,6-mannosyltransferase
VAPAPGIVVVPVRTVHLTNAWHPASGGIRTFYQALLERAAADRRHLAVIVPGERTGVTEIGPTSRLHTIEAPRSPLFDRRYRVLLPHRYLRVTGSPLWRVLAREQPDLIEISDKYCLCHLAGLIKARARGGPRPTLAALSQERLDDNVRAWVTRAPVAQRLAGRYLRWVYLTQFDVHLANSDYTAHELREIIARSRPHQPRLFGLRDRVHVLPMGVDVSGLGPDRRSVGLAESFRRRAGASGRRPALIVYAGRLSPEKHVHWIPEIVSRLLARGLDVILVIAGDGPSRTGLEAALERVAPGRSVFLGHVPSRGELAACLASADLFLHPNPREPFGIGPLEAMASGTPVVAPRAGGVLSYADDETAWLGDSGIEGLAQAAASCLERPAEARARAEAARARAARFAWPDVAARYLDLYDRVHAERLAARPLTEDARRAATAGGGRRFAELDAVDDPEHQAGRDAGWSSTDCCIPVEAPSRPSRTLAQ